MTPAEIISRLKLVPHPEGGHYRETWRAPAGDSGRGAGTAIYYLLCAGERSHWHRIDSAEVWHYYAGAPLLLAIADEDGQRAEHRLGADLAASPAQVPQLVVAAGAWQSARSLGAWTLVGCTVAPAFEFSSFELTPPDWEPPGRR